MKLYGMSLVSPSKGTNRPRKGAAQLKPYFHECLGLVYLD